VGSTSSGGILLGTTHSGTQANFQLQNQNGRPTDLPNVNAGTEISQSIGFASRLALSSSANRSVAWTEEYVIDRTTWAIDTVSFYANNSFASPGGDLRVAMRVDSLGTSGDVSDDVWVVSSTTFNSEDGTGTNFSTNGVQHTLNFSTASSAWQSLTFIPVYGSGTGTLATRLTTPGLNTAFPNGNITAFGLYIPESNGVIRFDTYEINAHAVPEPASVSLLALGLIGLARFRRRKK
jgi:hypothetical protein